MIDLYSANTPNGKKISIMLEEISYEYKLTKIDISSGEQFNPEFIKISPFSKIPVITDHENKKTIFDFSKATVVSIKNGTFILRVYKFVYHVRIVFQIEKKCSIQKKI